MGRMSGLSQQQRQGWERDGYFVVQGHTSVETCAAMDAPITEAHERNGPLWGLPGSHREPVHPVVPDSRPSGGPLQASA